MNAITKYTVNHGVKEDMNGNMLTNQVHTSSQKLSKKERVQKYGEVFTPQHIVEQMCDMLPEEAWETEKTFLEPACGDGVFVLEVLRRKFANCNTKQDYLAAIDSVWAMEIQPQNVATTIENVINLCRMHFKPSKADVETINNHIILCDSLKVMKLLDWWNTHEERENNVD